MVKSITRIRSPLNFLLNQIFNVTAFSKYLNCDTFKRSVLFVYPDVDLRSGDEIATHTYISIRLFLDQPQD
jgi:hypothetical protein